MQVALVHQHQTHANPNRTGPKPWGKKDISIRLNADNSIGR
jgi:hypothetical protein